MTIDEIIAGLPEHLQWEAENLRKTYGESVALSYVEVITSPSLNNVRRGLPRQHKRRQPK